MRLKKQRLAGLAAGASVLLTLTLTPIASAAPPTDDDVKQARENEAKGRKAVADIETKLASLKATSEAAMTKAQEIGSELDKAKDELDAARDKAAKARKSANEANAKVEAARKNLSQLAATAYRSGSSLQNATPYLRAEGLNSVATRQIAIELFGGQADRKMQTFQANEQVAQVMESRAKEAEAAATKKEAEVARRARAAQAASEQAVAAENSAEQEREKLVKELADLHGTTVKVERERQEELERQQRLREEAAAKARAEALARQQAALRAEQARQAEAARRAEQARQAEAARQAAAARNNNRASQRNNQATQNNRRPAQNNRRPAQNYRPPAQNNNYFTAGSAAPSGRGAAAVGIAKQYLGVPYVWGGESPNGLDCSGLVKIAYGRLGVSLPHFAASQALMGKRLPLSQMQPGDLIFWGNGSISSIYHVAIYVGGGMMIEAPRPGKNVRITPVRYAKIMPFVTRI